MSGGCPLARHAAELVPLESDQESNENAASPACWSSEDDSRIPRLAEHAAESPVRRPLRRHGRPEAFELLSDFAPEVCLVDLGLPDLDGEELIRELQARNSQVPIVVLTVGNLRSQDPGRVCARARWATC